MSVSVVLIPSQCCGGDKSGADTGGCTSCTEDRRIFRSNSYSQFFSFLEKSSL